ncbi:histidine kinase N-terminal 7TM domain-containing protein [uncultured Desulfosarcina sp.]|uniref:histidine kinase N-terminal 7TM domain-containing protein n=1 Tax=uncultured Desulfosarcina sp. TaxID=218289 RepID=UPI0029C73145|nr:histidine kinase N-terminal 7TM domain-containing protein [uncultured Desulfosarcina sp.]
MDLNSLYIFQDFAAAAISAALAIYLVPRWSALSARALLLLMVAVAFWSFSYGLEFKSTGLEAKLFWVRVEYLGAAWVGVLYFQFAMALIGKKAWLKGARGGTILILPALTILAVFTNPYHQLMWSRVWIDPSGPVTVLVFQRGIGFWIFVAYSYGLVLAGTVSVFHSYLFARQTESRHFWVVLIGVLAPWVSNIVYLTGFEPLRHIDLTPVAFTVSGLAFFWGTVRHQMLELIPIARDTVVESMQDAVIVLDLRNRIIDLNAAARRLLPDGATSPIGQYLPVFFPELYLRVEQSRDNALKDVSLTLPKGAITGFWQLRQSPLYSSGKNPSGWLIVLQDVTEQKHNEAALRESEEKFRSISASALDAIIMIDPDGRISFWNRAAEKIFGYRNEEVMGRDLHRQLAPESSLSGYREAFTVFQHSGNGALMGKTIEIDCRHKDGSIFPAELSLSPLLLDGQWHAVGILRDIAERKKTQEYLMQNEKMISLGGLAAGMAHEINNPLAGILSSIQVIRMRMLGDLPANKQAAEAAGIRLEGLREYMKRRKIVDKIEAVDQSCRRAAVIVRNMLNFARKSDTVFSKHDLAVLLDQTIDLAKNDFQLSGQRDFQKIQIERNYLGGMPSVFCDAGQIQQVVFNILKNGAQAMWEQGAESFKLKFQLTLDRQDEWARIIIADNGPGMPEAVRKRIFDPFYTTKPTGSGTGLGLSIAYFIVTENHSGRLTVDSSPGQGTVFTVRLPLTHKPPSWKTDQ